MDSPDEAMEKVCEHSSRNLLHMPSGLVVSILSLRFVVNAD